MKDISTRLAVFALCGVFLVLGAVLLPYPGIQNDEALFSNPIYQHYFEFKIRAFHRNLPLMLISYIGTLKTFLYWPIFKIFGASRYSVRYPTLIIGAITIFIFFYLARSVAGRFAAWIGSVLLTTDTTFLLTDTFDWGPVAIEHLLLVSGLLLIVKSVQLSIYPFDSERLNTGKIYFSGGFFLLGLALWNKAVFLWALAGLGVATLVVLWPEVRKRLNRSDLLLAGCGFLLGASPFIIYNIRQPNVTLRSNAHLEIPDWSAKFWQVRMALDGNALFGYLTSEEPPAMAPPANVSPQPKTSAGRTAIWIHEHLGEHTRGGMTWLAGICLLLVPLWWRSKAARFSLVFCAVTWLWMAVTKNAGTAAHHAVLLWPFPHLFVAVTLAALPWRKVALLAALGVGISNLLVWNEYLYAFETKGTGTLWTDAIEPLSKRLEAAEREGSMVYTTDWGLWNTLALLHRGKLPLMGIEDLFQSDPTPESKPIIDRIFADRNAIFVGHVAGREAFAGTRQRLERVAENEGLKKDVLDVIADSKGRPMFEIFRLAPQRTSF